jgi:hypothetical protein
LVCAALDDPAEH